MTASVGHLKGNWSITRKNATDVLRPGEVIRDVKEVLMLRLPVGEAMRPGATTFANAFDADNHEHVYYEALLQLVLKVVADMRALYNHEMQHGGSDGGCEGNPFVMCLEAVVGTEADAMFSTELENAEDLVTRPFLRDVPDKYPVVEYRLFVFIRYLSDEVSFGRLFSETIHDVNTQFNKKYGGVTVEVNKKKGKGKGGGDGGGGRGNTGTSTDQSCGGGGGGGGGEGGVSLIEYDGDAAQGVMQYGRSLKNTERWRLLRSVASWCNVADLLLGFEHLTATKMTQRVLSKPLSHDGNPGHPRYILSPYMYFRHPHCYADPQQTNVTAYHLGGGDSTDWSFPICNRVVRIKVDDQPLARFRGKLLPDYQTRSIGENIEDDLNLPARRYNQQYFDRMSHVSQQDIDLERQRLATNNALDEMSLLADPDGALDQPDFDEFGNAIAGGSSSSSAAGGPDAVGIDATGGTTGSRIMEMLNKTLPRTDLTAYDSRTLLRENYEDSTTLQAQNLLNTTDNPDYSAFHRMRFRGAKMHSDFNALVRAGTMTRQELRREYVARQQRLFREYDDACTSRTSDISHAGKIINAWYYRRCVQGKVC